MGGFQIGHCIFFDADNAAALHGSHIYAENEIAGAAEIDIRQADYLLHQLLRLDGSKRIPKQKVRRGAGL